MASEDCISQLNQEVIWAESSFCAITSVLNNGVSCSLLSYKITGSQFALKWKERKGEKRPVQVRK